MKKSRTPGPLLMKFDQRAQKYLKDLAWVQKDIWKLPEQYPRYDVGYCETFSPGLAEIKYSSAERARMEKNLKSLQLFMQGPFWLGEDVVIGGFWNKRDTARETLDRIFPGTLAGKRVLEIGSMSGYDSFFLNLKQPGYYLSIEPSGYHYQALFLNSIYRTGIDFKQWFWQDIPAKFNGTFDVILNCGCLYHEFDVVSMIKKTVDLLKVGGQMVLATTVIKDGKYADCIKYMPDVYAGDMTYWFAIGEKCLSRLFQSFGCQVTLIFKAGSPGDSGKGKTVEGYPLEAYNYYRVEKVSGKSRPLITIPRY